MLSAMAMAPATARSSRTQADFSLSTQAKHTPYGLPVVEDIRDCDLGNGSFLEGL